MRYLLFLSLLHPFILAAQTTHAVQVGGSLIGTQAPFYSPQHLTIDQGDIVVWSNMSGTHNVNGSLNIHPSNPEGFISGPPTSGNWTYSHTFDLPGVYDYHCDQQGHAATQHGTITVVAGSSIKEEQWTALKIFPNPSSGHIMIEAPLNQMRQLEIFHMDGQIAGIWTRHAAGSWDLDVTGFATGNYRLRITDDMGRSISRSIQKVDR
jgi:plastocyanin